MSGAVISVRTRAGGKAPPRPRRKPPRNDFARRALRTLQIVAGLLIIAIAVPISWLPGPLGLPIAVLGLAIVLQGSMWAKRRFVKLKRRHPNWVFPVRRLMRRRPEFMPVFWQMTLRTERLVLRRSRFLARWRRRTFRRRAHSVVI